MSSLFPTLESSKQPIQVNVVTGFLGAGKTTIILDLIRRFTLANSTTKLCMLKNEFGDTKVDSLLAKEKSIQVTEMSNGCLCCVLVGQMKTALQEIQATYAPDRIIIESSGSAFPAPIAWQLRQLEPEFHLDSIITVIDCINFKGYEDTSYTAKLQAAYTDVILLNKWDLISERDLDQVLDHVYELNEDTPKWKYSTTLPLDLIFGLHTTLFHQPPSLTNANNSTFTPTTLTSTSSGSSFNPMDPLHMSDEVDVLTFHSSWTPSTSFSSSSPCLSSHTRVPSKETLLTFLASLPKSQVFRVKGYIHFPSSQTPPSHSKNGKNETEKEKQVEENEKELWVVNHAFGRTQFTQITNPNTFNECPHSFQFTVMGLELKSMVSVFQEFFQLTSEKELHLHEAHR